MSFTPQQLANEIQKRIPDFSISFSPDYRQEIAATWPASINDTEAREHWGWKEKYDLSALVDNMIDNLRDKV